MEPTPGTGLQTTVGAELGVATTLDDDARLLARAWLAAYANRHTRDAYGHDLSEWLDWCDDHGVEPLEARRPHIDLWARDLEAQGRTPATVARKLASIASYYRYAEDEMVITTSPATRVRRPTVHRESPTLGLDKAELLRFLDAARSAGTRDYVLALLLAVNGLRVSEVVALSADAISEVRGHYVLQISGKANRVDQVPLPPVTVDAIRNHLAGRSDGPLLLDARGQRLDRHDAARIVRRLSRSAEISKPISPHSLRHTAITVALDAGVSLRDVQDFARHADPRTTRRYDRGRHNLDRHASYALAAFLAT